MNFIAFIPGRGGSKRLPNKNILPFCGKPLLEHTIEFALKSKLFSTIVLSSDSNIILSYGEKYKIKTLLRPTEISGDHATTGSAAKHCLEYLIQEGIKIDALVTLQITNPFRTINMLKKGIDVFKKHSPDSVISIGVNKHKLGELNENNNFSPLMYKTGQRSQDLHAWYYESGLFYITSKNCILNSDIFGENIKTIVTDEIFNMVDIDTKEDFILGELIYKNYLNLLDY